MWLTKSNGINFSLWSSLVIIISIIISCLPTTTWALSDKRLCADPKCERIISLGTTKINYGSGGEGLLSFKINSKVRVLSKSAGSDPTLWGVEINGRRGYVNKNFVMETKVLISEKSLEHEVPVAQPSTVGATPSAIPSSPTPEATTTGSVDAAPKVPEPEVDAAAIPNDSSKPVEEAPVVKAAAVAAAEKAQDTANSAEQPPQLNASESSAEAATTTTSPLDAHVAMDAFKPTILTDHHEKVGEMEAPLQSTPVKPITQFIDGTELPMDTVPNPTESANTNELKATSTDITNEENTDGDNDNDDDDGEEFDYEDDFEDIEEETKKDNETAIDKATDATITNSETSTEKTVPEKAPAVEQVAPEKASTVRENELPEEEAEKQLPKEVATEPTTTQKEDSATPPLNIVDKIEEATGKVEEIASQPSTESEKPVEIVENKESASEKVEETINETIESVTEKPAETIETLTEKPVETATAEITEKPEIEAEKPVEIIGIPLLDIPTAPVENVIENTELPQYQLHETQPVPLPVDQTTNFEPKPIEEAAAAGTMPPATLPPLFGHQNYQDPNEYYRKLQEQQQQQQGQQQQPEQQQHQQQEQQQDQQHQEEQQQHHQQQQGQQQQQDQQQEQQQHQEQQHQLEQHQKQYNEQHHEQQQHQQHQEEQQQQEQYNEQQHPYDPYLNQPTPPEVIENTTPVYNSPYDTYYETETTPAPALAPVEEQEEEEQKEQPRVLPSTGDLESSKEADAGIGLFDTILGTVNSFISTQKKNPEKRELHEENIGNDDQLHQILYPGVAKPSVAAAEGHCVRPTDHGNCHASISLDNFPEVLAAKVLDNMRLILCVAIAAASSLFFIFGYYCFCNSSQEGALLSKLNQLERSLLTAHKENLILKQELVTTRTKLSSIEDNSFGSNDMVVALKKQLETELLEKGKLQEQVTSLEKDLDHAAEAGLELNKMLSEVLSNQNGDEQFMSTVEELQHQLNDQEKIIVDINTSLAEKSRENSELQYSYTESTARLTNEMKALQQDNYELEMEKSKLQTRIDEIQVETEQELAKSLEGRNYEMQRLQKQILDLNGKWEKEHNELQISLAKIDALEECLKAVKKDAKLNVDELITSAKTRGELNAMQQKFSTVQAKLEQEMSARSRIESQLQQASVDVEQMKQQFNQSERDKLEAQTRLEVLSGYFRDKETQLQKELSMQEAKWLQHQGENTSVVETQTLMKNEIQTLKSQNDELRAEIEAQIASHKAQMGTLENRAHESWLAARQSERRREEALAEAAGLRRQLTAIATGGVVVDDSAAAAAVATTANGVGSDAPPPGGELNPAAPSPLPLPLPLPGSPLLNMPNALPFLAAPFTPFMGLPPPFLPPAAAGVTRPPPLGRMRSPPPGRGNNSRYSPRHGDYSDYDDYDDDDDDDDDEDDDLDDDEEFDRGLDHRRRRHSGSWGRHDSYNSNNHHHHHHHQHQHHSPRTYRSLSPSDSRYNYNETETDFSPPPSPLPPPQQHQQHQQHQQQLPSSSQASHHRNGSSRATYSEV